MALNLSALNPSNFKPVVVPSEVDRQKTLAQARGMQQDEQLRAMQLQQAEAELGAYRQSIAEAETVSRILSEVGGDIEKALPILRQEAPNAAMKLEKEQLGMQAQRQSIAASQNTIDRGKRDDEIKLIEMDNKRLEQLGKTAKDALDANKPIEVSPGASLFDRISGGAIFTAPKAETQKSLQQKGIEDPANPGKELLANYDPGTGVTTHPETGAVIKNPIGFQRPQDPAIASLRDIQTQLAQIQMQGLSQAAPGQIVNTSTGLPVKPGDISGTDRTRLAGFQSAMEQADLVEKMLTNIPTGAIKGYVLEKGVYWPVIQDNITPEQAEAVSEVYRLNNEYIKQVSGAAVSDQEMQRLSKTTPSLKLTPEANKKIIGHFRRYAKSQFDNYLRLAGWRLKEESPAGLGGNLDATLDRIFGPAPVKK